MRECANVQMGKCADEKIVNLSAVENPDSGGKNHDNQEIRQNDGSDNLHFHCAPCSVKIYRTRVRRNDDDSSTNAGNKKISNDLDCVRFTQYFPQR